MKALLPDFEDVFKCKHCLFQVYRKNDSILEKSRYNITKASKHANVTKLH